MSYHVAVSPDNLQSTHHISLSDGSKTIGLIICDSKGAADPYNISMAPNNRSSLRTKSGTTKYEDYEEPWSATAQDDWSGGRALEDYETDTTRFFDSKRCQTAFNQIYCAPLEHYAKGLKDAVSNYPGSVHWKTLLAGTKYAYMITLDSAMDAGEVYILMRRRGTPREGLTVRLAEDASGIPGTSIAEHTYTIEEITDVLSEWRRFTFEKVTLAAGIYWIEVSSTVSSSAGSWQIGMKRLNNNVHTWLYSREQWQLNNLYDLYFRLSAPDSGRESRFFTYKQLTFVITQLPSGSPKLYVNGDLGRAASNTGHLDQLIDSTKSWTTDEWKGCRVGIIQGTGIAETVSVWRTIVSNTATTLTVDEPWMIAHDNTTSYIIYDTDRFYEIPASTHGLTGYVTDVIVANNIIYFAMGDKIPIRKMKWEGQWYSIDDKYDHYFNPAEQEQQWWYDLINNNSENDEPEQDVDLRYIVNIKNCATYLQTVRDTNGLVLWRGQNNDDNGQISVSQTAVTDWMTTQKILTNLHDNYDLGEGLTSTGVGIIPTDEKELYTNGVDFGKPDDVAMMYKITVGKITDDEESEVTPSFTLAFQASEDNIVYEDVKTVTLETSHEELYVAFVCRRKWRRLHITIASGTTPILTSLKVETVAHSKFVTPMTFNDSWGKITGLAEYPQMANTIYKTLWINREGMIHSISGENVIDTINLEELGTVMEEWNGKVSMNHNVYYYVKWMKGSIQRYYNQQLDSVGPDRDTGLPEERRGAIADMLAYPGRFFTAIDAGAEGYSSVLLNNNSGWHEIFRAPNVGERIRALGYQAISGDRPDRLWISVGDDVVWLVMPSNTLKAYYDDQAEYVYESVLISSWLSIGMVDVIKQWGSMNVMAENLKRDAVTVEADYQIDQDPTWYPMVDVYTEGPTQEVKFRDRFGISAKRLRYRLRLQTNDMHKTPFIKAVVLKTVFKVGTKYNFGMSCRNVANDENLCGEVEDITPWDRLETLMDWANNATALQLRGFTYPFDDRIVFIDPPTVSNLREKDRPGMLMTISLNEI